MLYWGELPAAAGQPGRGAVDVLQAEPRAAEPRAPAPHQPRPRQSRSRGAQAGGLDPLSAHTVRLLQHCRRLRGLQQAAEAVKTDEAAPATATGLPPPPPLPILLPSSQPEVVLGPRLYSIRMRDPDVESSEFARGQALPQPELHASECRRVLGRAVASLVSHAGFDTAFESALETLTDVVHEFYLKLGLLLRTASDHEALMGCTAFPDVIEQVFHEIGIGSSLELRGFWQRRVRDYHAYVLSSSKQLTEEYERMLNPARLVTVPTSWVKEEPLGELISFPVSEESEAEQTGEGDLLQLDMDASETAINTGGADGSGNSSPLWGMVQVKSEPPEQDDAPSGAFDEPMSTMSEGSIALTPSGAANDAGHLCPTPDSSMASPPVFGHRPPRKKLKKL
uniref:STAGA complex 65 subunit gamma-like n=1 Tax=Myxine glutinosa TaxID=7769 RepID=UPI00358EDA27